MEEDKIKTPDSNMLKSTLTDEEVEKLAFNLWTGRPVCEEPTEDEPANEEEKGQSR